MLTPQERRIAYCAAVPDGPGMTLLTADEASRAMSDFPSGSSGVTTEYEAASTTRIKTATRNR
jgi:hypothetical protein